MVRINIDGGRLVISDDCCGAYKSLDICLIDKISGKGQYLWIDGEKYDMHDESCPVEIEGDEFTNGADAWKTLHTILRDSCQNGEALATPPTAEEIADAIVAAQRNVEARIQSFSGTNVQSLSVPAGTFGRVTFVGDHGAGVVRMSIDGTDPDNDNYMEFNARHTINLDNVPLDLVRLNGSSGTSDYSIVYEIYN